MTTPAFPGNTPALVGSSGPPGPISIATHSLSFVTSSSQTLSSTGNVSANQQKFTVSAWVKLPSPAINSPGLLRFGDGTNDNFVSFSFIDYNSSEKYNIYCQFKTDAITVDGLTCIYQNYSPLSIGGDWHHVCFAVDSTQADETNRVKIYIDGTLLSIFYYDAIPQNANLSTNADANLIGYGQGFVYLQGNLSEFYYIDGQTLNPTYFITGTPGVPKTYSGTYTGVYDTYLNFNNTASVITLGYDSSGENNNWTLNNMTTANSSGDHP